MKNRLGYIVLLTLLSFSCAQMAFASGWTGNVNIYAGQKTLNDNDSAISEEVEDQGEIGLSVDFREESWPVSAIFALFSSKDDGEISGIDVEGSTTEFRMGLKKIWQPTDNLNLYLSGGLASISAKLESSESYLSVSDDDNGLGAWAAAGVYLTVSRCMNIGLEVGYSAAEVTIFDEDADVGGTHFLALVGYNW